MADREAGAAAAARTSEAGRSPAARRSLREFIATQNTSAAVLLAATIGALVWANSPWSASYERLWETELSIALGGAELALSLRHWINDGLMALFFFVAGLEIRREFDMGELRERRRVATPVIAAIGGMAVPALIYLAFTAGTPAAHGWGITMGTDTAFALGILTIVGGRWTPLTRTFLLTLVIVDDIVALTVIALAYTTGVSLPALVAAFVIFGLILLMRRGGVRHGVPYFLAGTALWLAVLISGVHATIAGVAVGLLAYAYPPTRAELEQAGARWRLFREEPTAAYAMAASRTVALAISPNERLQHLFHPWTGYVIVPLFALANAGVRLDGEALTRALDSSITFGVVAGLVIGKPVGITLATFLFSRRSLGGLPLTVPWPPLIGAATVAGIGFTVALLVATISLSGTQLEDAKIGILGASIVASILAWIVFRVIELLPRRLVTDRAGLAAPLLDLAEPIDPERDHIRGPTHDRLTLVEYGDFQCPHCGRAEPVIRQLGREFGEDLRFVFRHLPLTDVHEHAQLAAEAAEAAGAQGRFWEMHDRLFARQDALALEDLRAHARELGLDEQSFLDDLQSRRQARRVARDVASAEASHVAGTPTFFINGRRHYGAYDLASLTAALRREAEDAPPVIV